MLIFFELLAALCIRLRARTFQLEIRQEMRRVEETHYRIPTARLD